MRLFDWVRGGRRTRSPSTSDAATADRLAMDTMNRVLPAFISGGGDSAPVRREATYLLGTISFVAMVAHPRFDEHSGHAFFNRYLGCLNAYGIEAGFWPDLHPPFLSVFFPDRLEEYLPILSVSDPTDSGLVTAAFRAASQALVDRLESDVPVSSGLVPRLASMAAAQWVGTLDLLGD